MKRAALVLAIILVPTAAFAAGGLQHAEEFVLKRDGAWIVNALILFGGLYWLIKRFGIPALQTRSEDIAATLDDAEKAKNEAMKKLAELESKLKDFEEESRRMKNDAAAEGELIKREIIDEAKAQAERILHKAKQEIEAEKHRATNRLRKETAELAVKLATESIQKGFGADDQKKVVADYLSNVEGSN